MKERIVIMLNINRQLNAPFSENMKPDEGD